MKKMKKILLLTMALGIGLFAFSQKRAVIPKSVKNISFQRPLHRAIDETSNFQTTVVNHSVSSQSKDVDEAQIGNTTYDLQTNSSVQNRFYRYADGTMAGTWTMGFDNPGFPNRGTGYNYFNGTDWGHQPTESIESVRVGWPSYAPYGADGEIVVAHNGSTGLNIATREHKGTGDWTESTLVGPPVDPAGTTALLWPRMTTSGINHDVIHIIATTDQATPASSYHGQELAIVYSRSTDGGHSWEKENVVLAEMDSSHYTGFAGDTYEWAEPKGDTIAFLVGDSWIDIFLMKSTDCGDTWTKTIVFQHPYPMWTEDTVVLDTPYVCDGAHAVVLDNDGEAHVFFGIMRVLNSTGGDGSTSYFPYVSGLAYWNESMPTYTNVDPDSVYANETLVGELQDLNGNDSIDFPDNGEDLPFGIYYLSLTSMPNATIDADGNIFLVYSSYMENLNNDNQGFRHLIARESGVGGTSWGNRFLDINPGIAHAFDECVFPSIAPTIAGDDSIYLIYQADEEPGMAVRGDEDPYGDNQIYYLAVPKSDIVVVRPTISISSPTDGQIFTPDTTITVSGTASDADGTLTLVQVKLNDGTWQDATGTTEWSKSVTLHEHDNIIYARAQDDEGNWSISASVYGTIPVGTDIIDFSFAEQTGPATIGYAEYTVGIEVVHGTDVTALTPTITVSVGSQISPTGVQNFTDPFTYTVTDADEITTQDWVVTVTVAELTETDFAEFSFAQQTGPATIDTATHIVSVEVDYGTDVTALALTFTLSEGASASVAGVPQVSGVTVNDFTDSVTYTITAGDGLTTQDWVVTVSVAVSVENIVAKGISVYPNPCNGVININVNENYKLEVIDITGRIIDTKVLKNNNNNTVNISNQGIYFLRFSNENNTVIKRVIVK